MIIKLRKNGGENSYKYIENVTFPQINPVVFTKEESGSRLFTVSPELILDCYNKKNGLIEKIYDFQEIDPNIVRSRTRRYALKDNGPYPHGWQMIFEIDGNCLTLITIDDIYLLNDSGKTIDAFRIQGKDVITKEDRI